MGDKRPGNAIHSTTLAFDFLAENPEINYLPERDEWLDRKGHYFEHVPYQELMKRFWRFATSKWRGTHFPESKIKDAIKQFSMAMTNVITREDDDCVAFDDGILDLRTGTFSSDAAGRIVTFHLPYRYHVIMGAEAPRWKEFLTQVLFADDKCVTYDPAMAELLQECFGYCLFGSTAAETAFFLVGDGANGKSVVAHQLLSMIGRRLTTAMSIETLTTRPFSASGLVGKRLNLTGEEESKFVQSDKFKALVSGETVTAERKFGDAFEFSPRAKFVFLSNAIPSFSGLNYGIIRRLKIIPFHRQFKPAERDTKLKQELARTELLGIVRWAVEGALRLARNNFVFTSSAAAEAAMKEFESDSSSAVRFFRDAYELDPAGEAHVCNTDIYAAYKTWCEVNGKKPLGAVNFFRDGRPAGFRPSEGLRYCITHAKRERGYCIRPKLDDTPVPVQDAF